MGICHLIVVGEEPVAVHLSGLQRFGCAKAVLFSEKREETRVERTIVEFGTDYTKVVVKPDYKDVSEKASGEASSAFNSGLTVAVNMCSGNRLVVEAVEEAVRLQQYYLMRHTSDVCVSAFRYFYDPETKSFAYIPYWNTSDFMYTRFLEILSSRREGLTLDQIHKEIVKELGEAAPNWEAFRKLFREFKRYLVNLPFYSEGRGKKARYSLAMRDG
jgi:hypothetical protein